MTSPIEPDTCWFCGETAGPLVDDVLAEFWDVEADESRVAHGQCGIDAGMELA